MATAVMMRVFIGEVPVLGAVMRPLEPEMVVGEP